MGSKEDLVLIDTNIFVIDLRYKRDIHYEINRTFLTYIAKKKRGFTTIINLLEICGILSFNLNERQLNELWFYFKERYQVSVLPDPEIDARFPAIKIREILKILKKRTSLGDALMIAVAKKHLSFISTIITWDKRHFEHIFSGNVLTPKDFLSQVK
ncbi:hypothetical protein JCM13304A_10120 [Desulfothermus okinawensis JCM 13304]